MIGIIDYRMGNLRSVQKAFELLGAEATILSSPVQMPDVDHLVLPGVGAFADGMTHLRQMGWTDAIANFIGSQRPFLGICLGMQLLFSGSQEDASSPDQLVDGLGVLPGTVERFNRPTMGGKRLKVPHMGWNTITWNRDDPLLRGVDQDSAVYFVHCYYVSPEESRPDNITSATTDYGGPFCASIWRDCIWATQFHPEKSQRVGLKMLANFIDAA